MGIVVLLAFLALGAPVQTIADFRQTSKELLPSVVLKSDLCRGEEPTCWEGFEQEGEVWAGDVNGDGQDELMVHPGGRWWRGTGGRNFYLYQKRGEGWVRLSERPWLLRNTWFIILPRVRIGYHDLCLSNELLVKWNGKEYVTYAVEDYRTLRPEWFDANWLNANIFWALRYAGLKKFELETQWFGFPPPEARSGSNVELIDRVAQVRWVSVFKGGVWGVRDKQAFLLLPSVGYLGAFKLQFEGDWLLVYGQHDNEKAVARYNRRTRVMQLLRPEEIWPMWLNP